MLRGKAKTKISGKKTARVTRKTKSKIIGKKTTKTRIRRTNAALFISALKKLSGDQQQLISNGKLRESLKWDLDKYERIKRQLKLDGTIIVGLGQGGSVGLAGGRDGPPLKVFISYSHVDETLKNSLLKHLEPLVRLSLISHWNFRELTPGVEWDPEINRELEKADIVLLLVSIDFINSKYCYDIELDVALDRHETGKCRVIPIVLRDCLWKRTPFSKLQALPRDGKPANSWSDLDEALTNVAEGIHLVAEEILASR